MRRLPALAVALGALAATAVAAAIVVPFALADLLWATIAQRAATATGIRIEAEGTVRLKLFPSPRLLVSSVEVANAADVALVHIDRVRLELAWPDLLTGRVDARRAELRHTRFLTLPPHPPVDVELQRQGEAGNVAASFEGGTLRSRIRPNAGGLAIETLTLTAGAYKADGAGTLTSGDEPRVVLTLDRLDSGATPLGRGALAAVWGSDGLVIERLSFQHGNGAEVSFFGLATTDHGAIRLEGGFEGRAPATAGVAEGTARLAMTLGGGVGRAELTDIELRMPDGRLSGSVRADLAGEPNVIADFRLDTLRLDGASTMPPELLAPLMMMPKAELRLRVGRVSWTGGAADGVILDAAGEGNQFTLRELAARNLAGAPFHARGRFALDPAGAAATFEELEFRYATLSGTARGSVDLAAPRPRMRLDAALNGPLALDAIVPPLPPLPPEPMTRRAAAAAATAASRPVASPGWSRERLSLPPLPPIDADIHLTAPRLLWRGFSLDQAELDARLAEEALIVDTLAGQLYGGRFELRGRAAATGGVPVVSGDASLAGSNLKAILREHAGLKEIAGSLDGSARFTTTGGSPAELIAGLKGGVQIRCRDGAIDGFNLPGMSDGLKRLQRPTDLAEVFRMGLGGGRTPFSTLEGTFRVEQGVARTEDLRLSARGGEVRTTGSISLPAWSVDMINQFRLSEHPDLPPFSLKLSGPIDAPRRIFDLQALQSQLVRRGRPPAR